MTTRGSAPIAVALDASDVETAASWAHAVTPHVSMVKVGLQMFCRHGPDVVAVVRGGTGVGVFLDLKLHDIPVTVAGAVRSVARLRPRILTVHATGGAAMVRAAVAAADETAEGGTHGLDIAAVTVLTSLTAADLGAVGVAGALPDAVRRLAVLAVDAGARAIVCSPQEVAVVRPVGAAVHDQARVATPQRALDDGADLLVIGRPITAAADPGAAAAAIAATLRPRPRS